MKKRILAILLVVALLTVAAVFTVQAESTAKTPAEAQTIIDAAKDSSFTSLFDGAADTVDAPCPVCGDTVTWYPLASGASGQLDATDAESFKAHYYLAESFNVTGSYLKTVAYDNDADSGVEYCLYLNGNTITAESLRGIFVQYGSTLNLLGEAGGITAAGTGTVATNSAHRGAIDTNGEVNVYGGTYQNVEGTARSVVSMRAYDFAFNMYGGTIQSNNDAYAVYMYNTSNKGGFNAVGGTIDGGVCIDIEGADVSVDGTAVINSDNGGLDLTAGAMLTLGDDLTSGADITVTVNDGAFTNESANAGTIAAAGYIKDTETAKAIRAVDKKLTLGTVKDAADAMTFSGSTTAVCPYCGSLENWTALEGNLAANKTVASGHYYLAEGGSYTSKYRYEVLSKVCVVLNGQSVECTEHRAFRVLKNANTSGELTIMGTGNVTGLTTAARGAIEVYSDQKASVPVILNLFGGTYAANNPSSGGVVINTRSSTAAYTTQTNIYDGTIISGHANQTKSSILMQTGKHTINMYGGTISGGKAVDNGGSVYVNGAFNMYGGTIENGNASSNGGNIYVEAGTVKIDGGQVTGGDAARGGNIYVKAGAAVNVYGGSIYGGEATEFGGNIYGLGDVAVSGGTVYGGTAASNGGNIYVYTAGLNITGGNIYGGTATASYGGNIYAFSATSATISGGEIGKDAEGNVVGGTAGLIGGNLYLAGNTAAVVSGDAVITGGSVTAGNGGNIGVGGSASLTLNGTDDKHPVISNGTANNEDEATDAMGGNIYVAGTLAMNHGELLGGYADDGGSVAVYGGTATISGGEVNGTDGYTNTTDDGGLFFLDEAAALTINGTAVLKNGKVTGTGGLVYATGASSVTVGGEAQANEGHNNGAIYIGSSSNFTVAAGFTGNVQLYNSPAEGTTYGSQLVSSGAGAYTCTGEYTGIVRYQNLTGAYLIADGTALKISGVVLYKDGEVVAGAASNADAVAAFDPELHDFIRSYTDPVFNLTSTDVNYVIDLDGKDITVNGVEGAKFFAIDTEATFNGPSEGSATLGAGVINGVQYNYGLNNRIYIGLGETVEGSNVVTCHLLEMKVTGVSLRSSGDSAGIYYWTSLKCDSDLQTKINESIAAGAGCYGIMCNLDTYPDLAANDGVMDEDWLYTAMTSGIKFDGTEMTGGLMENVLTTEARTDGEGNPITNDVAGNYKIWGVPYIMIAEDTDFSGSDEIFVIQTTADNSASLSMYDIVDKLNTYIGENRATLGEKEYARYVGILNEPKFMWREFAFTTDEWVALKDSLQAKLAELNETAE